MKLHYGILVFLCLAPSVGIADDSETRRNASTPAVAIEGYSIVSILYPGGWVKGESDIYTDYSGRRYLFISEEEKLKFDASPKKYAPVFDGLDAVALLDEDIKIAGSREWGCYHQERMFFFSREASMQFFMMFPDRYVARVKSREKSESRSQDHDAQRVKSTSEIKTDD